MTGGKSKKVLFVCLGNICRSPTAEAVFRNQVNEANLAELFEIDSAGTAAWHIGKSPDSRTSAAARARGIDMADLKARQVTAEDFMYFDYIFAMDADNQQNLKSIQPADTKAKLGLLLEEYGSLGKVEVPDPYYGGEEGFEEVLDLLEDACSRLLRALK